MVASGATLPVAVCVYAVTALLFRSVTYMHEVLRQLDVGTPTWLCSPICGATYGRGELDGLPPHAAKANDVETATATVARPKRRIIEDLHVRYGC